MTDKLQNNLSMAGGMLISNANTLLEEGRKFIASRKSVQEVVLDLSGVKETDSAALSVLFSLMRSAQAHGMSLRIMHPPASLTSLAQMYGVSTLLPFA